LFYLGGCYINYMQAAGSVVIALTFAQRALSRCRWKDFNLNRCKLSVVVIMSGLYYMNLFLCLALILLATFKCESLMMRDTPWDRLLSPFYFYMTEALLIAIVAFVVLVNGVIQVFCGSGNGGAGK
jgi:hypothetical protein